MNNDTSCQQMGASNTHSKPLWQVRLGAIIWFILALGFLLSLPVLLDASFWVVVVLILISCIIAIPITFAIKALRQARQQQSKINLWGKTSIAILLITSSALALPIYYLAIVTETRPTTTPQATLTNGQKVVVFQGMQHFASDNFYKSVIFDVEKAI